MINCLLEVARLGYKFGLEPPNIIKMETEIEEEEEEIPVSKPVEIVRPLSNKGPNLDAEVLLLNKGNNAILILSYLIRGSNCNQGS